MRLLRIACIALTLALGGSSVVGPPPTGPRPAPEVPDAAQRLAMNDPSAPQPELSVSSFVVGEAEPPGRCVSSPGPAGRPITAPLGEPIVYFGAKYTIQEIGVTGPGPGNVWLAARVEVTSSGCLGSANLWDFLFTAADGTTFPPSRQERRGEFTWYDIPAGTRATGLVFFDLPASVVAGGAVGLREPLTVATVLRPTPARPYGLWPVPASPPTALPPDCFGRR
ncbi:hypothetical protein M1L60_31235 [Actinoplanes sp. TRM 88003]|uniref:DUF4352 domain-containing protein n=1 Tax=Paractinoplanes aksuensis TaxID=2939490 RepID=A0ABT1DW94_9ACTN|nr:hypothetical protein [Actinoplanes aksuensis]MCO8275062.1 hypothetical protein [Actinoplanes aksuensis]